jgi:Zn-dependent M28 family amino/carboxypeptidase
VSLLIRLAERAAAKADGRSRFVLVGAEEPFIAGSRAYVAAAGTSGELDHCRAALNLDMVAFGSRFAVRCVDGSPWRRAAQRLPAQTDEGTPITHTDLYRSSDHWAFHEVGIPSAQLTREPDGEWHSPGDRADRISRSALDEAESVAAALIDEIDAEVKTGEKRG